MRDQGRRMVRPPPFACGWLTVLFLMPILRHDVCGREGDDLGVARADDDRRNGRMVIQGVPVGELTRETVWTMEGLGGKVLRAIKSHAPLMVQNAEGVSQVLLLQVGKDLEKDGVEIAWRNRIEERADVIVARDRLNTEERLRVILSLAVVALALVRQKRRRLHEKDAQGSSGSVLDGVTGIRAGFAHVGEVSSVLTQNRLEMIEA